MFIGKSTTVRPLVLGLLLLSGTIALAQSSDIASENALPAGHLIMIGGGLLPNNEAVYRQLIESAGGVAKARFVVLPTASMSARSAHDVCEELALFGLPRDRAEVLDCMEGNAATATSDPANLERIRHATAVFLSGGDQRRLVRLMTKADGSDTPLLSEIRKLRARGGLIAGTSAGASAQSETMLAVSGLPDTMIDEGLDTLDFGITNHSAQRGLLISRGFGFFKHGIIDQHFYQFRGRLGRLALATTETGVSFGFGIDENTAVVVESNGTIRVVGAGFVTIVDSRQAHCENGPFGAHIRGVSLNVLSDGDTYDPISETVTVDSEKKLMVAEKVDYNGNFLINDISGASSVPFVLISGLAENRRTVQEALALKFHGDYSHGYRFTFRKGASAKSYSGIKDRVWVYSLLGIGLDILPIANGLKPSSTQAPLDIDDVQKGIQLSAIAFRGLMPVKEGLRFRPKVAITRAEFAQALARSTHLTGYSSPLPIKDIDATSMEGDEILRVVNAGLMVVHSGQNFEPDMPLDPADATNGLLRLADRSGHPITNELKQGIRSLSTLGKVVSREQVGLLLHQILRLP